MAPEISKACSAFKMLGTPSHCDTAPQDYSPRIQTCCLPGHTEVAFPPPHPSIVFTWVCALLAFSFCFFLCLF